MKWRSGGICPSSQNSLEAWNAKNLTTACRTRLKKGWCVRLSCSEESAGRSNGSAGAHQDAFGTSSAQPSLQLVSQCCFQSRSAAQQVCRREGIAFLTFCSALMAGTGVGSFCLTLRTATGSTPTCPASLTLLLLTSAAPPALSSGTNTAQAPGQSFGACVKMCQLEKNPKKTQNQRPHEVATSRWHH